MALLCPLLRCCRWLEPIALARAISLSNPVDFTRYIDSDTTGIDITAEDTEDTEKGKREMNNSDANGFDITQNQTLRRAVSR